MKQRVITIISLLIILISCKTRLDLSHLRNYNVNIENQSISIDLIDDDSMLFSVETGLINGEYCDLKISKLNENLHVLKSVNTDLHLHLRSSKVLNADSFILIGVNFTEINDKNSKECGLLIVKKSNLSITFKKIPETLNSTLVALTQSKNIINFIVRNDEDMTLIKLSSDFEIQDRENIQTTFSKTASDLDKNILLDIKDNVLQIYKTNSEYTTVVNSNSIELSGEWFLKQFQTFSNFYAVLLSSSEESKLLQVSKELILLKSKDFETNTIVLSETAEKPKLALIDKTDELKIFTVTENFEFEQEKAIPLSSNQTLTFLKSHNNEDLFGGGVYFGKGFHSIVYSLD